MNNKWFNKNIRQTVKWSIINDEIKIEKDTTNDWLNFQSEKTSSQVFINAQVHLSNHLNMCVNLNKKEKRDFR